MNSIKKTGKSFIVVGVEKNSGERIEEYTWENNVKNMAAEKKGISTSIF
jgi:hypothetical protein